MDEFTGRSVKIILEDDDVYDGFVHSFNTNSGKLSLEKVTCYENGQKKKLMGLQHFFANEIVNIVATEEVVKSKSKSRAVEEACKRERSLGHSIMKPKYIPAHLQRLDFLDPSSLVLKNSKQSDGLTSSGNETDSSDSDSGNLLHEDYTVLGKINNVFHEAISHIRKHHVVGMCVEGVSIGRSGRMCWLQLAVPDHVFLFDVLRLGRQCFDEGLKSVLEDEDILKVLHDCRMVSDMLHHQYNTSLVNVFDTQVANVFVYRLRHHNDWPRYVEGLAACLVQHLDLSMEEVNWAVVRERSRESDEEVWTARPVKKHLIEAAVKNVKHLLSLREVLMEKMLEEFVAGVNIYLTHVKDASASDSQKYQGMSHLLPVAFQDVRRFMVSYSNRNPYVRPNRNTDQNGFIENCSGILQPHVYFSRDSLWHSGSSKTKGEVGTKTTDMVQESKQKTNSATTEKPVRENCTARMRKIQNSATSSNDDLVKEMVDQINSGNPLGEISGSQHDPDSSDNDTVCSNVQEGETAELKGSSLMRSLIQKQSPEGSEDTQDMDSFQMLPAGKMVEKNMIRKTKLRVIASVESYDDLCKPITQTSPSSLSRFSKCLTPQEMKFVQQVYKSPEQERLTANENSDTFKKLKISPSWSNNHDSNFDSKSVSSRSLKLNNHVQDEYSMCNEPLGNRYPPAEFSYNTATAISEKKYEHLEKNGIRNLISESERSDKRLQNLSSVNGVRQECLSPTVQQPQTSPPQVDVSNRRQILMNLVKQQKQTLS